MNIKLKTLTLTNFKGIRSQTLEFGDVTNIYGDNGVGKTTIFDSFFWLLFDKNSANESNFSIKTNDEDGNPIHNLTHNVTGSLEIDGSPMTLSKTITEKWVKKRGSSTEEFSGHETKYEINNVPLSMSEYKKRIQDLIDEKAFMLLTNPMQFSQALSWKERREMLMKILGELPDADVIASNPELNMLEKHLEHYTVDELQKMTKSTKSKLNDDLKMIPERIKEVQLSKIDPIPVKDLEKEKKLHEARIYDIEQGLKFRTGLDEQKLTIKKRIYTLEGELFLAKRNAQEEQERALSGLKKKSTDAWERLSNLEEKNIDLGFERDKQIGKLKRIQGLLEEKLAQYKEKHKTDLKISDDYTVCPTCKRPYDDDQVTETLDNLKSDFNRRKSDLLTKIKVEGDDLRKEEKAVSEKVEELHRQKREIVELIHSADEAYSDTKEAYEKAAGFSRKQTDEEIKLIDEIELAKDELNNLTDDGSDLALKESLVELKEKITLIDKELAKVGINDRADQRITQLEDELTDKSEEYGNAERLEYAIEQFIKAKVKLLESRINDHFTNVRFKMFETQINGGISETCEALVNTNGALVPFKDANHAGKVNAGLDIINTLTEYYEVTAPIWIDERGEVNKIIDTKGQLINLYVSLDKNLRIEKEIS